MLRQQDCIAVGGDWLIGIDSCTPNPCIPSACCFDTSCEVLREHDCVQAGGEWNGEIDTCDPNPCLPYACCIGELCQILTDEECATAGGDWRFGVPSCEPNPCYSFVVRADGTGDYPTIQDAIDNASSGQAIELADGVFVGDGNRDITYRGKDVIVRSQSGDPSTCIIDCEGSPIDRHRGFDFASGETRSAILEGVTITNGYVTSYSGGGISCTNNSSPTITSCVLRDNYAGPSGGGIYIRDSQPDISYCTIDHNASENGGGIRLQGVPSLTLRNCTISHNTATVHAGGVLCFGASLAMESCIVSFSTAGEGFYCYYSDVDLFCCDVYGNEGGDWIGCIEDLEAINGNICEDPRFCDPDNGDFFLDVTSPCAPHTPPNEQCDLIGACPIRCELQGVGDGTLSVSALRLDPIAPNPFSRSTVIGYALPRAVDAGPVDLSVFDAAGRLVCTLANGERPAGGHTLTWRGTNQRGELVAAGVYLCKLSFAGQRLSRRIVLIR
jgi:hypothetical protein